MIMQVAGVTFGQQMLIVASPTDAAFIHQIALPRALGAEHTVRVIVDTGQIRQWESNAHFESGGRWDGHRPRNRLHVDRRRCCCRRAANIIDGNERFVRTQCAQSRMELLHCFDDGIAFGQLLCVLFQHLFGWTS